MMRRYLFLVLLSLSPLAALSSPRVMESRDLFNTHWANNVAISHNGAQVAYARNFNDVMTDQVVQTLWSIDTASGAQRPITPEPGHYGSPRWSPTRQRRPGAPCSALPWP